MILVERQTRFALACKLPNKQAETINEVVKNSWMNTLLLLSHQITALNSVSYRI